MRIPDQFPRRFSRAVTTLAELAGLPPGRGTELLAEAGGLLQGRFLLTPGPGRPTLERRLAAIGLADQAAAALVGARLAGRGNRETV